MTHKIFKVLEMHYIHIDEQTLLCPLADYLTDHVGITVVEVRYYPRIQQGVVIVRADVPDPEEALNIYVENFLKKQNENRI